VASGVVPFLNGGGRMIAHDLVAALRARGHDVEALFLPQANDPRTMLDQVVAMRLLDVADAGERLIAIRLPSYFLRHPSKVLWFIHHERMVYDLWGSQYCSIPNTARGRRLREAIVAADDRCLPEARAIFTNSRIVSDRLKAFNGLDSEVLYPPLGDSSGYRRGDYGDYVFYPSRITRHKRQHLLAEAMAHVESGLRLVIAGAPDGPDELVHLEEAIERAGVATRVTVLARWISDAEKRELMAGALACAYLPFEEDSYGYVSLEGYEAHRPVLTCTDSGGTLEIVEDGVTGRVAEPNPPSLARAMDELAADRPGARRMGEAGRARMDALNISWDHVVARLLA
jgi:glycosyltransferase involved in cell wall biosynthesis